MKRLIALGVYLIVGIEVLALALHDRRFVLAVSGAALALVLLNIRRVVGRGNQPPAELDPDDLGDSLRRWLSNTEATIRRSDSTRVDWDRHLRPMLARRYEIATGQRQAKDPAAFQQPAECSSAPNCGNGLIQTTSSVAVTVSRVPAVRRWKRFCGSWSRYDDCRPLCQLVRPPHTARRCSTKSNVQWWANAPHSTLILTAVLARGHVLIEDLPGLGKTLIARSFAAALGLEFTRVQFTPDLLPADLLGSTIYDMQSGRFAFRAGPIFTNLLLADEINRTPPKTQAALLEAMAEGPGEYRRRNP